ncbi:MAG: PilZ domain-containing protein [Myxococcota bacterium]|nr:PilZ domain-containing protein [Myxococcota bacterium]
MRLTAHCRLGNRFLREPVANLSLGGLFLKTRERTREGTPIRVALALPYGDGPRFCTLAGTVVRVERDGKGLPSGIGVSFSKDPISTLDRLTLQRFVALRGGAVTDAAR